MIVRVLLVYLSFIIDIGYYHLEFRHHIMVRLHIYGTLDIYPKLYFVFYNVFNFHYLISIGYEGN